MSTNRSVALFYYLPPVTNKLVSTHVTVSQLCLFDLMVGEKLCYGHSNKCFPSVYNLHSKRKRACETTVCLSE